MKTSNKNKTIAGLIWSLTETVASRGIQFIVMIILARFLSPAEFGIIGMIMIFIEVSNSFIDSGFSQALVREKDSSQKDFSTVFFFNLFVAIILYVVLFFSAPVIVTFFNEPKLLWIVRVVGINLIINAFTIVQRTVLIKKVDFKTQTKIHTVAAILAGAIAISLAYYGFGVWSLVANMVFSQFFQSVFLWLFNRWIPSLIFSKDSFKRLFAFGSKLLMSGILDKIYHNIYYVVIGRFFSAADLGYFTNARKFKDILATTVTSSIQRVTYPVLSSIQEENERLKAGYKKMMRGTVFAFFPIMMGLAAAAEPLIVLTLGQQWYPSVVYLQLLSFAGMLYPLHAMNLNVLKVKGRSDLFLRLEIIKKVNISIIIILVIGFGWGIIGLLIGMIVSSYLAYCINTYYSAKLIDYRIKEQVFDLLPAYIASIIMGITVYGVRFVLPGGYLMQLIFQILIGAIVYILISAIIRIPEFKNGKDFVWKFLNNRKQGTIEK
jgi:O-antigen/teichoic acid export membrane protein